MKKGDIYLIDLISSFSHEQYGFRPAIIMSQAVAGMIIVVPLTTNLEALRFPYTLSFLPNSMNNLTQNSIALVFQLKSIDKKRIKKKIGRLSNQDLTKLEKTVKDLFNF